MVTRIREPQSGHRSAPQGCSPIRRIRVTSFAVGVLATLMALPGATQENVNTEDLPSQELLFGVAPAAQTQRLISPLPEVLGKELAGFYPSLGIGAQHHSNVRRTPDSKQSDTAYIISPALAYRTHFGGRHSGEIAYAGNFVRYSDIDDEDTTDHGLDAALRFDLSPKLDVRLFAEYDRAHEERGGSGARTFIDNEPDKVEARTYGGDIIFGRSTQTFQGAVGASKTDWDYRNNDQEFRDRDYNRIYGTLFYNVKPKTSLFVELAHTDIDYDNAVQFRNLDSEEQAYYLGAIWRASVQFEALAKVGRLEKDMDDPRVADYEGTTYLGKLIWRPRHSNVFQLLATRTAEETAQLEFDEVGPGFYVSRLIGLSWLHELTARWRMFAYYNQTDDDHPDDREDTIKDYGIGLIYRINNWLSLTAQYGEAERDSNVPEVEYEDRIGTLLLRGDFRLGGKGY